MSTVDGGGGHEFGTQLKSKLVELGRAQLAQVGRGIYLVKNSRGHGVGIPISVLGDIRVVGFFGLLVQRHGLFLFGARSSGFLLFRGPLL